jgi:hypothetical protein
VIEKIGWEAWTRTRIARVRVWSPTNWTTSQLLITLEIFYHATALAGAMGANTAGIRAKTLLRYVGCKCV